MKTAELKAKLPLLIVGFFLLALSLSIVRVEAAPITCTSGVAVCPFVRVSSGDVLTGGQFDPSCDSSYQSPVASGSNNYVGAIMTFANTSRGGSGSDLAALALGLIEGDPSNNYGFYSGPANYNNLSFANVSTPGSNWGGIFESPSSVTYSQCIPDYYGTKKGAASAHGTTLNPSSDSSGNYTVGGDATLVASTVGASKNIAYFVNGDVIIAGDVNYAAHGVSNTPKLAVVAKGNIFINSGVHNLSGWYIAQPTGTAAGEIRTCSNGSTAKLDDSWIRSNCASHLDVNGALTAKQVTLDRIAGGIYGANAPAEQINYTQDMTLGGSFFNETNDSIGEIQSLVSLPPVF